MAHTTEHPQPTRQSTHIVEVRAGAHPVHPKFLHPLCLEFELHRHPQPAYNGAREMQISQANKPPTSAGAHPLHSYFTLNYNSTYPGTTNSHSMVQYVGARDRYTPRTWQQEPAGDSTWRTARIESLAARCANTQFLA